MHPGSLLDTINIDGLRRYLLSRGVLAQGALTVSVITGGRSNLTFKISDESRSWVLRRPPVAGLTPSAHDVGREYQVINALQQTAVPVAGTVVNCTDESVLGCPFTIVDFVPGRMLQTQADLATVTDHDLAAVHQELVRVLVELHDVPFREVGLSNFGRGQGFYERQVRRWGQQWEHVSACELADMDRLRAQLAVQSPPSGPPTLVHGDYRIDNALFDSGNRMLALVDWEMSTVGDPLTDVAMLCVYQHHAFDHVVGQPAASTSSRWPGIDTVAQEYSAVSGRPLRDFSAYLGLGYFKLAVIAAGIAARYRAGGTTEAGYATAELAVQPLVAAGLSALAAAR